MAIYQSRPKMTRRTIKACMAYGPVDTRVLLQRAGMDIGFSLVESVPAVKVKLQLDAPMDSQLLVPHKLLVLGWRGVQLTYTQPQTAGKRLDAESERTRRTIRPTVCTWASASDGLQSSNHQASSHQTMDLLGPTHSPIPATRNCNCAHRLATIKHHGHSG